MSRQGRTRAKGPRYQIRDPQAIAEMVRAWVDSDHGGNVSAAAKALGIPQPTLHRLVTAPPAQVAADTLRALDPLLTPDRIEAIVAAVLPPHVQRRLGAYRRWLDASITQLEPRKGELRRLLERVKQEVPHVYSSFEGIVRRPHMSHGRGSLAMMRMLEPLLAHHAAGGIERAHQELSREEFRRFVEAGWAREEILLDRDPEVVRAQVAPEFRGVSDGS